MTDIPIIFSAAMVRALLDDRKSMTRRLAWREPSEDFKEYVSQVGAGVPGQIGRHPSPWQKTKPGDRLYVREAHWAFGHWDKNGFTKTGRQKWRFVGVKDEITFEKPASVLSKHGPEQGWYPRLGRFMPRAASRLTLIVTATKIERLQDISADDVRSEGLIPATTLKEGPGADDDLLSQFEHLWDRLHGKGAWLANPEIIAISFTVHQQNIDRLAA